VHQSVQRQGGTITVESAPGKGTKFLVFLPAKPLHLENPTDAKPNN
jgi:signal transduction histidine kinase